MVSLIRTEFSKTRMAILRGSPGLVPVYVCCHGKIINNAPSISLSDVAWLI